MENAQALDEIIVSLAKRRWQKTAMIIANVLDRLEVESLDVHGHRVEERIVYLVKEGRLEAQGDLSRWRHSEVRLPSKPG